MEVAAAALAGSLTQALRRIRRSPGFSAAVVATLALGVGANAATFRPIRSPIHLGMVEPEALARRLVVGVGLAGFLTAGLASWWIVHRRR